MSLKRALALLALLLSATPSWAMWQGTYGGFYTRCDPNYGTQCVSYGDIGGGTPTLSAIATGHRFVDLTHGVWLATAPGTGHWIPQPSSSNATPGGNNTDIQFNDGGNLNGDDNWTWDKTNHIARAHRGAGSNAQFQSDCTMLNADCLVGLPCNTGGTGDVAAPTAGNANLYCNGVTGTIRVIFNGGSGADLLTAISTNTFSNKTFPVPGTGNSLTLGGQSVTAVSGNTTTVASAGSTPWASNQTLCSDASGNVVATGGACASGVPQQSSTYITFPQERFNTSASTISAANLLVCMRWPATRGIINATHIIFETATVTGTVNGSICIYPDSDAGAALARPSATVVWTTGASISETPASAFSLTAGVTYRVCWANDTGAGAQYTSHVIGGQDLNVSSITVATGAGTVVGGLCPSTTGALTANAANTGIMHARFTVP